MSALTPADTPELRVGIPTTDACVLKVGVIKVVAIAAFALIQSAPKVASSNGDEVSRGLALLELFVRPVDAYTSGIVGTDRLGRSRSHGRIGLADAPSLLADLQALKAYLVKTESSEGL